ncbi:MAG TPA: hypothetical protein VK175_06055 [Leadbetterella sp.]|nr:hypothetical protein [Leadbetterella sp.]
MSKDKGNINNDAIGRSTDFVSNSPHSFDVGAKREEFGALLGQLNKVRGLAKRLAEFDAYYLTAEGVYEVTNVKAGRASFAPTARAVMALEKLVESEANVSKRVSRKKLVGGSIVKLVVWGMLLGLKVAPAAAQRTSDGCMTAVVEDPSANVGATMIVSGLIIFMISTVTWMWWWDYKNRMGDRTP